MKYVKVPDDVSLFDLRNGKPFVREENGEMIEEPPFSMGKFLVSFVLIDQKWGKGWESVRSATKIYEAFRSATPGTVVALEDADYKTLMDILTSPSTPFNPYVAIQCASFMAAVESASSEASKS